MDTSTKRVFTIKEQLRNIYYASKSFVILKRSKKYKLMNKKLKERIMLSITEVNGCSLCSFVHTKIALSAGMSKEDIKEILDGNHLNIPVEDAVAVIFAQHFASSKEQPDTKAIERIVEDYGYKKAELILAACNVITMTNGMGISMDNFYQRLLFNRDKNSNILNELLNPLFTMLFFPLFTLINSLYCIFKDVKLLHKKYDITPNY